MAPPSALVRLGLMRMVTSGDGNRKQWDQTSQNATEVVARNTNRALSSTILGQQLIECRQ